MKQIACLLLVKFLDPFSWKWILSNFRFQLGGILALRVDTNFAPHVNLIFLTSLIAVSVIRCMELLDCFFISIYIANSFPWVV